MAAPTISPGASGGPAAGPHVTMPVSEVRVVLAASENLVRCRR
jgi:hypothetical protein